MQMLDISTCILFVQTFVSEASVKALVQDDFPVYALSKHKQIPYLKANKKKKFTKLSFCIKITFGHQTSSCKCSMCHYCVSKVSNCFIKAVVQVDFPSYALSMHKQNPLRITKAITVTELTPSPYVSICGYQCVCKVR